MWLRKIGSEWDADTSSAAAEGGHQETLSWLLEQGCPCSVRTCHSAASEGHLATLVLLRERFDCPWDEEVCVILSGYGNLEMLRWAIKNGCPYDRPRCLEEAKDGNYYKIIGWLNSAELRNIEKTRRDCQG